MLREEIKNTDLTLSDIPGPLAKWEEIEKFALTFDGYEKWGSSEKCAEVANAKRSDTLTELRTCLFFEQRRWRWNGGPPEDDLIAYARDLLVKIRAKVVAGQVE